jgi:hypothetical protein
MPPQVHRRDMSAPAVWESPRHGFKQAEPLQRVDMSKKILFICGSLNQTTMMHQIAIHLPEFQCSFTPFYATGVVGLASAMGLLDFSILGGNHQRNCMRYLTSKRLPIDIGGKNGEYDIVFTCTDLLIQSNIRGKKIILVQEGMTEPESPLFPLVRHLKPLRFIENTAATGLSDAYDVFCVASYGYRDFFLRKGVKPQKIVVTGIPNFDHAESYLQNDFPYHDYVLVATSSIRETLKRDDRMMFLQRAKEIAKGRKMIFKLHPNENEQRARLEISQVVPDALILTEGNTNHMVANCDVLITQTSSVVYIGIALGKEVYSNHCVHTLKQLTPMQNGGRSAKRIAEIGRQVLKTPQVMKKSAGKSRNHPGWQKADLV